MTNKSVVLATSLTCVLLASCGSTQSTSPTEPQQTSSIESQKAPGSSFDLSHWYLTVPLDEDGDQVSDIYDVADLQAFSHPDFFYLDRQNNMVFATPNRAATERTSTNTRSELRYMLRGEDTSIPEGRIGE